MFEVPAMGPLRTQRLYLEMTYSMIRTLFAGPADLSRVGTGQFCLMGIIVFLVMNDGSQLFRRSGMPE